MNKQDHLQDKGVILLMSMIGAMFAAVMLPAVYSWVQNETRTSSRAARTTVAFHMAEQGVERGLWKLQESNSIVNSVAQGGTVPGYNFDVVYTSTDSSGGKKLGEYKIKLSPGSNSGEVKILSVGRDVVTSTNDVRAIEAVYKMGTTSSGENAIETGTSLTFDQVLTVHWSQVTAYDFIHLNNATVQSTYYPKKIAKAKIDPWDTDIAPLNSSAIKNYEAYRTDLTVPTTVDLDYYKEKAKQSSVPDPVGDADYWDELENRKPTSGGTDKLKEPDWGVDFNGDGDVIDSFNMDDIKAGCGTCYRSGSGGPPAPGTPGTYESNTTWNKGITLYECTGGAGCSAGDPFYLDLDGDDNFTERSRPMGIVGVGNNGGRTAFFGTGYFNGTGNVTFDDYHFSNSTSVIFIESASNIYLSGSTTNDAILRVEALLSPGGDVDIHSQGKKGYVVSVPANAWKQYTSGTHVNPTGADTAAINEYPGDAGLNVSSSPWTLPALPFDAGKTGVAFHGFLYSKTFNCYNINNIIVGMIRTSEDVAMDINKTIYSDATTASAIKYIGGSLSKVSWRELKTTW